ncbi:glycosyltransferase family 9 protein [Emticicia sp. BO119]|uniref:glycosyltransferase family 9 protein n=1 Tax=Emticicia sp. BO119 TaxID=2757768 RepID=UPI0015F0E169|nr:glycosyltransferase family 9 protein [Emticicia sp. BO119]MBA4850093.1 glycosyltransferase family 9 protein [Emticicia sp. BO119]
MQKFIELWQHRYHKYTHLLKVYLHFLKVYFRILFLKIRFSRKKKIVAIVLTQQFGDIVAGEPITRQIRKLHPEAYILWIVKPVFRELLINNPNLNGIIEEFCANQRRLLINSDIFDLLYNLQFRNNSYCSICNTYVENPVAEAKGITINNYYFQGNLLTVQQKIGGIPVEDLAPNLFIADEHCAKVDSLQLPKNFMVIHCQSAQNSRNWDSPKWEKLINYMIGKTDYSIVEVGLRSDLTINSNQYVNLCGKLNLLETGEVIKRAILFIGIDSGPAHLANAVGTFGIIMIGKLADFINHIPYSGKYKSGENALILRNTEGPSSEIPVEKVIEAIWHHKLLPFTQNLS